MNHTFTFYCLWALSVVKLCRPLGACHAVKIKIHLHVHSYICFYSGSTHPHTSTLFHIQIHPKLFYSYLGENSQKHYPILVIPCEINAQVISVTTTCYIISKDECSKKRYEEIKRGKCPEPRRKEKVRREVKIDKCPTVELGVQDTHLREKKNKI